MKQSLKQRFADSSNPLALLLGVVVDLVIIVAELVGLLLAILLAMGLVLLPMAAMSPLYYLISLGALLGFILLAYLFLLPVGGVYRHTLARRYLRRKLGPKFAVLAVTLCTAMVLIVISVMGGFLDMMRGAARTLTGDITISADLTGFAHYDELLLELQTLPEVEAGTPVIEAYGLLNIGSTVKTVEVLGVRPNEIDEIVDYKNSLAWTKERAIADYEKSFRRYRGLEPDEALSPEQQEMLDFYLSEWDTLDPRQYGMTMMPPERWVDPKRPDTRGIVLGIHVNPYAYRDEMGQYDVANSALSALVTLTVLPTTRKGAILQPAVRELSVVNEIKSGLFEVDARRVYVPMELLQKMLLMDAAERVDPETGEPLGEMSEPRVGALMVSLKEGSDLEAARDAIEAKIEAFRAKYPDMKHLRVLTWEEQHATLLNAVEKEKGLLTILFSIVSLVAVVMIAVIFYMIVLEKTRDVGILRAMGASRIGIASIFLSYGLVIGLIGAGLGLLLGAEIVWHLNEIQDALDYIVRLATNGEQGFKMWDPRLYYFEQIPSQVNPNEMIVIGIAAVMSAVVGSLVPAILASRLDPVEALRYE